MKGFLTAVIAFSALASALPQGNPNDYDCDNDDATISPSTGVVRVPQNAIAVPQAKSTPGSLDAKFKAKGKKYFGTIIDRNTLAEQQNANIASSEFGQITAENSMKWDATEPNRGQFNFQGADAVVNFATQNGQIVRGHTLLWHSQLAAWAQNLNAADMKTALTNHIQGVMGKYKGQIYAWDVVNEILDEQGGFRISPFNNPGRGISIDEMVRTAFTVAKQVDPAAKLYINDYNLDNANAAKTQAMARNVRRWISQGIPIDGIGSQSHLQQGMGAGVKAAMQTLCAAAPECAITELDIRNAPANDYTAAVRACLDIANCVGLTVWGISDKDSWRKGENPLLFDGNFQKKAAYNAVSNLLN